MRYIRACREWHRILPLYPTSSKANRVERQYYAMDCWLLRKLAETQPDVHISIGGRIDGFVGQYTAMGKKLIYYDIVRPGDDNIRFRRFDFFDKYTWRQGYKSVSCMHVLEHIGTGRYDNHIDRNGWRHALDVLKSMIAPGGDLFIGVPVNGWLGNNRFRYNAGMIFHMLDITIGDHFIPGEVKYLDKRDKVANKLQPTFMMMHLRKKSI